MKKFLVGLEDFEDCDKYPCYFILLNIYPTVTSARSCNKVCHLFWFTILVQHKTN